MESSIAEFLKRQSACELLPTDPFPSVQHGGLPVMGQLEHLGVVFSHPSWPVLAEGAVTLSVTFSIHGGSAM